MLYKIGTIAEIKSIVFENETAKRLCQEYATILTEEYGADRNVDTDDGGYILYATNGTNCEAIKNIFDYTQNLVEFVDVKDDICVAVYILSNDYGVVLIMSTKDAPPEILKEINNKTEE